MYSRVHVCVYHCFIHLFMNSRILFSSTVPSGSLPKAVSVLIERIKDDIHGRKKIAEYHRTN